MLQAPINLACMSPTQIEALLTELGQPKFRKSQLMRWIWREGVTDFDAMTNISKDLRAKLQGNYRVTLPTILTQQKSEDGTVKYLLKLEDGRTVETVWIPKDDRVTVCISTQVGCKMGCTFCLTAQQRVERNLTAGEIAGQLLVMPDRDKITNVVFMGMGEPLDNYDNVLGAIDLMTSPDGLEIGIKKITVSTSGLVPAMRRFVKETRARLAVSLNATNDEVRSKIMPINKAYNLDTLLGALKEIAHNPDLRAEKRDFLVTFEYIIIKDINDSETHARELVKRVRGIPCKINILLYNENPNVPFKRPDLETVEKFRAILGEHGLLNFVRNSRGRDISAACGQLASIHKRQTELERLMAAGLMNGVVTPAPRVVPASAVAAR